MANRATIDECLNLVVWQKLMSYVTEVYRLTNMFPVHEVYGLGSDMRRSALTAPKCVAEGYGSCTQGDLYAVHEVGRKVALRYTSSA